MNKKAILMFIFSLFFALFFSVIGFAEDNNLSFIKVGELVSPLAGATVVNYGEKIYIFGGAKDENTENKDIIVYDINNNTSSKIGTIPDDITTLYPALLNGKIYLLINYSGNKLSEICEFNPTTYQMTKITELSSKRDLANFIPLNDKIYIISGGIANTYNWGNDILEFDPAKGSVKKVADLPYNLTNQNSEVLYGKIYILGGYFKKGSTSGNSNDILEFDPSTKSVRKIATLPQSVWNFSTAVLNNKIYTFGGYSTTQGFVSDIYVFDPIQNKSYKIGDLPYRISSSSAATIDNKIYIIGGFKLTLQKNIIGYSPDVVTFSLSNKNNNFEIKKISLIRLYIDNKNIEVTFSDDSKQVITLDVAPYLPQGVTFVPVRGVFEQLGATVKWVDKEQKVEVFKDDILIELYPKSDIAYVNGVKKKLLEPVQMINNRTLLPLRFLSETLGYSVKWNEKNKEITISYK